jgi:hypothetical protein
MTNSRSKQVRTKRTNNERWYKCVECHDFTFAIYNQVGKRKVPHCPKCGENTDVIKIDPPVLSARESYKPWEEWEVPFIHQVINGEMLPYQCAIKLDRSLASIESKCRRVKRDENKNVY